MANKKRRSDKLDDRGAILIGIGILGLLVGIVVAFTGENAGWAIAGTALALILTGHLFRGVAVIVYAAENYIEKGLPEKTTGTE